MKQYLENLGSQILEGVRLSLNFSIPKHWKKITRICFFGMGGSAISGDLLRIVNSGRTSFHIFRFPQFPEWIGKETLAIFSSYSGNTAETLGAFKQALKRKVSMLAVTSGGELEKLAVRYKVPVIRIPSGYPPRCAIGYLTFSLLPIFHKMGWANIPEKDLREAVAATRPAVRKQAKVLARRMAGCFPHFYGVSGFAEPVLARWRAQFAENAKTLSSSHLMPEMFHNEIEGWQFPKKEMKSHLMVFFTQKGGLSWLARKTKYMQNIASQKSAGAVEIKAQGRSKLAQLFSLMVLADWTSYELALLNGVDPLVIPNIERLKKIK